MRLREPNGPAYIEGGRALNVRVRRAGQSPAHPCQDALSQPEASWECRGSRKDMRRHEAGGRAYGAEAVVGSVDSSRTHLADFKGGHCYRAAYFSSSMP